jgi:threonine/homoserine/homoserine lactone efflux protein
VLCIRRTLAPGRAAGLASGLGAATADAIYGGIAAFGLTALSDAVTARQAALSDQQPSCVSWGPRSRVAG